MHVRDSARDLSVTTATATPAQAALERAPQTVLKVLAAISFCHFLNDTLTSLLPAIYPMLKSALHLSFREVGLITLAYQSTASLLQPVVGIHTDRHPQPYSLAIGMGFLLTGLLFLSTAPSFGMVLISAAMIGTGSSIFHPESSRVARMASGGQPGLAQSLFQVGGNAGTALAPLLAAFVVLPRGQSRIAWFSAAALVGMAVLARVGGWTKANASHRLKSRAAKSGVHSDLPRAKVVLTVGVLMALLFSKFFYLSSINSYYTFYLMQKFGVSVRNAQVHLFVFLASVALGTILGGPVGDRIGRKYVIWYSILGVLPFTLVLPYANLFWTGILTVAIGLILASAFPAIVVYAQELLPGRVGMISGLFFGFAFGMGGIGAAVLGALADRTDIRYVYHVCSFLPAIGLLAAFLPRLDPAKPRVAPEPAV
jgi:MFS transporter, FSR family, fosmidomycin resistance protein